MTPQSQAKKFPANVHVSAVQVWDAVNGKELFTRSTESEGTGRSSPPPAIGRFGLIDV